jgi:hypothetical protein
MCSWPKSTPKGRISPLGYLGPFFEVFLTDLRPTAKGL